MVAFEIWLTLVASEVANLGSDKSIAEMVWPSAAQDGSGAAIVGLAARVVAGQA